jgi:DNA-binding NarL/FixJ family response regulator
MGIRVLVADGHVLLRQGIRAVLQSEPSIEVVGEASDADRAIEVAAALNPDLVLIEIMLPGDGVAAVRIIRQRCPRTQVLILTSCADQEVFKKAAAAGAIGYVLKDIEPANLMSAMRAAHEGRTMLSPTIAKLLVDQYFAASGAPLDHLTNAALAYQPTLARHEIDVLAGVAQGLSDKRIAANLFLSEATVKTRLRSIYHKHGLRNRAHAAVFAVENGLLKTSSLVVAVSMFLALLTLSGAA